jgi:hypothetical protein
MVYQLVQVIITFLYILFLSSRVLILTLINPILTTFHHFGRILQQIVVCQHLSDEKIMLISSFIWRQTDRIERSRCTFIFFYPIHVDKLIICCPKMLTENHSIFFLPAVRIGGRRKTGRGPYDVITAKLLNRRRGFTIFYISLRIIQH